MPEIRKATVLRTSALFGEGERPAFRSGPRTTFVVTRAVLEDTVGGGRKLFVYGYRLEGASYFSGYDQPGSEPKFAVIFPDKHLPPRLEPMLRRMEEARGA
jgi:hypothetical protein